MFPVILLTTWHTAQHLMHLDYWATRIRPGVFAVTPAYPSSGPVIRVVSFHAMTDLIRHGSECTHHGLRWLCTANQIP
jgi:hypothetical protein